MEDRIVQYPYRYKLEPIDPEIGIYDLKPFQGQVTAVGSMYNKANVLPDDVCRKLGFANPKPVEIKDALAAVANGRYFGKLSKLANSQTVGHGGEQSTGDTCSFVAKFSTLEANSFENIVAESDGTYQKIPIPVGANKVSLSTSITGARATFGSAGATIRYYVNGVITKSIAVSGTFGTSSTTVTQLDQLDVLGDGNEYLDILLTGSGSTADSDERGFTKCNYMQLEVIS